MIKLVIGAGTRLEPGFKHHDVQALPGIDYVCEFYDLPKHIENGTVKEIHMTHVLEHFPMKDVPRVLEVLHNLLCDGGTVYIEVPNFEWHAQQILYDPTNRKIVEYAYGGQHNEWDFHYNGFTPDIIMDDFIRNGFKVERMEPNSSIELWAKKR